MGRRLTKPRDATMRFIEKKDLWKAVARQCRITPRAVKCWSRVPLDHVREVEKAIGRHCRLIRPDVFDNIKP